MSDQTDARPPADTRRGIAPALRWCWRPFDALAAGELHAALALRAAVFVVEQECVFLDPDDHDVQAHHLLGWHEPRAAKRQLVAYLRVVMPGRKYAEPAIGRVVTAHAYRRSGVGRALMLEGLRRTRETYPGTGVRISAQRYLAAFYRDFGFAQVGAPYCEDGIPHVEMLLPANACTSARAGVGPIG